MAMSPVLNAVLAGGFALCSAAQAVAQENLTDRGTFFGWLPGLSSSVATPFGDFETEVDISQVLQALEIAACAAVEARNGPAEI